MVTNGAQVNILAWHDNEWCCANRLAEPGGKVARLLRSASVASSPIAFVP